MKKIPSGRNICKAAVKQKILKSSCVMYRRDSNDGHQPSTFGCHGKLLIA